MPEEFKTILRDLFGGNVGAAQEIMENQDQHYECDPVKDRNDFSKMLIEARNIHCNII